MSESMKPAGGYGWVAIGAKNPKNAEALRAAGIEPPATKKKEKKEEPVKKPTRGNSLADTIRNYLNNN